MDNKKGQLGRGGGLKFCLWVFNSYKSDVNLKLRLNVGLTLSKEDFFKGSTNINDPGACATLASKRLLDRLI